MQIVTLTCKIVGLTVRNRGSCCSNADFLWTGSKFDKGNTVLMWDSLSGLAPGNPRLSQQGPLKYLAAFSSYLLYYRYLSTRKIPKSPQCCKRPPSSLPQAVNWEAAGYLCFSSYFSKKYNLRWRRNPRAAEGLPAIIYSIKHETVSLKSENMTQVEVHW